MTMNFNDATGKQRFLIPHGTLAVLQMKVRPGNAGEGRWLKRSTDGNSEALDTELTVIGGPYDKRKLWLLLTLDGTAEGHGKAAEISRIKLCAILECARGIRPGDQSETARQGRQANSWGDFDGMRFLAKIGIEKGKAKGDGSSYSDKNNILEIITPDRKDWQKLDQPPPQATPAPGVLVTSPPTNSGEAIQRPQWSR
jgi:hypothetical protein